MKVNPSDTIHPAMTLLDWLIGSWRAEKGFCQYPTFSKTLDYEECLQVSHFGQPFLTVRSESKDTVSKKHLHGESGYIRVNPNNPENFALILSHMNGITEISEGYVDFDKKSIKLSSTAISGTSFGASVQKLERHFTLISDSELEQVIFMETVCTPLTEHCRSLYRKIL